MAAELVFLFLFSAWMIWDDPMSFQDFYDHVDKIGVVSIQNYSLTKTGDLVRPAGYDEVKKKKLLQVARLHHTLVLGLAANSDAQGFWADGVEKHMTTMDSIHSHAETLAESARLDGFDGVDLDYENLKAKDRDNFSILVSELAKSCHERKLKLAIALPAKTSEPGSWDAPIANDYRAIGAAVDFARIMTYDEHWDTGAPGPVASKSWVEGCAKFTASVISPDKVDLGVPGYGYDWDTSVKLPARSVGWNDFKKLTLQYGKPMRDLSGEVTLNYRSHQVWFEDAPAYKAKFELALKLGLHGMTIWRLGTEDPGLWDVLKGLVRN